MSQRLSSRNKIGIIMKNRILKFILLIFISTLLGIGSKAIGLNTPQALSVSIFSVSILGTLFFWDFRLSFAFLGTSMLLITRVIDLENLIKFSSLEVILFLVGMMVLVGLLKDAGFFAWIVQLDLTHHEYDCYINSLLSYSVISAILSTMTSEVSSIIFMVAAVLEICDYFEVDPVPYIIISVLPLTWVAQPLFWVTP